MTSTWWAKMPCGWQRQESIHRALRLAPVGEAIAALKLYLALCILANFHPTELLPSAGSVKRPLEELSRKTNMTKPLAIKGMRLLERLELIRREVGKPNTYVLADYDTSSYWTKLPRRYLMGSDVREIERLATLPNRGQGIFEALQFYIYIASIRDKNTYQAKATYETITATLTMSRNAVSQAITILSAKELISMRQEESLINQRLMNVYRLLGPLEAGKQSASPLLGS